jgi:hypothetical protein
MDTAEGGEQNNFKQNNSMNHGDVLLAYCLVLSDYCVHVLVKLEQQAHEPTKKNQKKSTMYLWHIALSVYF